MTSFGVSIKLDTASPAIARIRDGLANRAFRPAIGEAGKLVLMEHFASKEADANAHRTANRLGARPTGLYAGFARATQYSETSTGVALSIKSDAIRQRLQGGAIKPVNGRYLSIPANAAAYGKRISDFGNDLVFGGFTDEQGRTRLGWGLRDDVKVAKTVRRKVKEKQVMKTKYKSGVYFWAVRGVNQPADPTVLPTKEAMLEGIDAAVGDWLEEQNRG